MNDLVVDSSVVIKWFVSEDYDAEALRILDEQQKGSVNLLAPDFLYAEAGNIVWKKHRFQGMDTAHAEKIVKSLLDLELTVTVSVDLLDDAYQLAAFHQRTVYDAMYLALSRRETCPVVTADKKLFNAVQATFPNLVWVADWKP